MAQDTQKDESHQLNGQPTPFQKFEDFVKKIAAVPKKELDEKLAEEKREREETRAG